MYHQTEYLCQSKWLSNVLALILFQDTLFKPPSCNTIQVVQNKLAHDKEEHNRLRVSEPEVAGYKGQTYPEISWKQSTLSSHYIQQNYQ